MGMKTANENVYSRIKSASSLIASGVRLGKPDMEQKGREEFAAAHVENAILVHREFLTPEARSFLAHLVHTDTLNDAEIQEDVEDEQDDMSDLEEEEEFEDEEQEL